MVECVTAKVLHIFTINSFMSWNCIFSVYVKWWSGTLKQILTLFRHLSMLVLKCFCSHYQTAEMALRLTAINRWCVTGTPLIHSVEGIVDFFYIYFIMIKLWQVKKMKMAMACEWKQTRHSKHLFIGQLIIKGSMADQKKHG